MCLVEAVNHHPVWTLLVDDAQVLLLDGAGLGQAGDYVKAMLMGLLWLPLKFCITFKHPVLPEAARYIIASGISSYQTMYLSVAVLTNHSYR